MRWKDPEGKDIIMRSSLVEITSAPSSRGRDLSMGLKYKDDTFQQSVEDLTKIAQDFLLENSKRYADKSFDSEEEFEIAKLFYGNTFYVKLSPNVIVHKVDKEETKKQGKTIFKPVTDIKKNLGVGSKVFIDAKPTAFFYKKMNKMYPLSLYVEKIVIVDSKNNKETNTMKRHGWLEGFACDTGINEHDYKVEEKVPVTPVTEFKAERYTLSKVVETPKGHTIYARYDSSSGPTYFKTNDVVNQYDITPDPQYGSRSIVIKDTSVIEMVEKQFAKLLKVVQENSKVLFGEEHELEIIQELCSHPLYSQRDTEKKNPRVSLKLPKNGDNPLCKVYLLKDGSVEMLEMDTYSALEEYLTSGTIIKSLVFMMRPVIVGDKVYLSGRVEQILLDPNQERVFTPSLAGYAFDKTPSLEDISFSDFNKERKSFEVLFGCSRYGCLPEITIPYTIGIVDDPENNQYAYRVRYNHTEETLELINKIDEEVIKHVTKNSKEILGFKKSEKIIQASMTKGRLVKYSKTDEEKKYPYSTFKTPVIEKYGKEYVNLEVYQGDNSFDKVSKKLDIKPEDLPTIFYQDAVVKLIIRVRGNIIDKRIVMSTQVAQVLISSTGLPYSEDDIKEMASAIPEEVEETEEVRPQTPPLEDDTNLVKDDSSSSEEEESDDE
jgi:DNA-directed RNA polymerase subunit H (RpoH/RPB5)